MADTVTAGFASDKVLQHREQTLFAPPETGKIAVKVINHYGDEVLKVFDVV